MCVKPTIRKGGGFSFTFNLVVNNILVSLLPKQRQMRYQGTFISASPTVNRAFGEPINKTINSHEVSWNTKVYNNDVSIDTKDGREFSVRTLDWRTYNRVVNTIQINTI